MEAKRTVIGDAAVGRAARFTTDRQGMNHVDLSKIGGPRLGPFVLRREALNAEVIWLEAMVRNTGGNR